MGSDQVVSRMDPGISSVRMACSGVLILAVTLQVVCVRLGRRDISRYTLPSTSDTAAEHPFGPPRRACRSQFPSQ